MAIHAKTRSKIEYSTVLHSTVQYCVNYWTSTYGRLYAYRITRSCKCPNRSAIFNFLCFCGDYSSYGRHPSKCSNHLEHLWIFIFYDPTSLTKRRKHRIFHLCLSYLGVSSGRLVASSNCHRNVLTVAYSSTLVFHNKNDFSVIRTPWGRPGTIPYW